MKKTIKKVRNVGRSIIAFAVALVTASSCIALADGEGGAAEITNALGNLRSLIQTVAIGIGAVLLIWNVIQLAIAIQSHDASQRAQSFIGIAAAVLIAAAGTIASYIMG